MQCSRVPPVQVQVFQEHLAVLAGAAVSKHHRQHRLPRSGQTSEYSVG